MLRDVSWLVAAFLILTMALGGVCARHIDKRNAKRSYRDTEKHYRVPSDSKKSTPREYKHPSEYIVDR